MTKTIKYSVIIPIYNSEKTIARCLESLIRQNRTDVQIIAVNDGSTDRSEEIVLRFAEENSSIEYIFQDNAGVSRARNTGLEHAKGTYVTFVDSDDYVTEDYFSVLDRMEDCDLLVFAHQNVGGVPLDEAALFASLERLGTSAERLELLLSSRKIMSPVNKRFKRKLIEQAGLRFLPGMFVGEDFNFCMAYSLDSSTVAVTPDRIVCVDISDQNSLSRRYRPDLDMHIAVSFSQVQKAIQSSLIYARQREKFLTVLDYLFVKHVFSCIAEEFKQNSLKYLCHRKEIAAICDTFQIQLSDTHYNFIHCVLRLLLKWRIYWPFYLVTYLAKGRKYKKQQMG